jgi:nitroimidazol reductase NimA-like FMN-containing flavoprotein (pyridoxamine 5'-phosphate oxidase superfamily)
MLIHEMTETECHSTLAHSRLGRLACAHENQPYIVPIYFVYEGSYLYGFTTPGQKVEWMRSNPLVCVELDEVVNSTQWMSIVIFGSYEELPDAEKELPDTQEDEDRISRRRHAYALMQQHAEWWEPGAISNTVRNLIQPYVPVFYRIHIDRISGRRISPSHDGPMS